DTTLPVDVFNDLAAKLRSIREDKGNPEAAIPKGIGELPLPVQRHLASKGLYIDSFVMHVDFRIAKETLPFFTTHNVATLINYRGINELLLQAVLHRKEFFVRLPTVMVALHHPKCTVDFARSNLPKVGAANLAKIVADRSAHPAVRQMAKALLDS